MSDTSVNLFQASLQKRQGGGKEVNSGEEYLRPGYSLSVTPSAQHVSLIGT